MSQNLIGAPHIILLDPFFADRVYRVFDLKAALHDLTSVPPQRQKILGLVKGKLPPDEGRMCAPDINPSIFH
jgi:hypothetical protein